MMNGPSVRWRIQASAALRGLCLAVCMLSSAVASAGAFYLRYDGDKSYPEQDGWTRLLHDPEAGLIRTLEDGSLVLDTRASLLTSDAYQVQDASLVPSEGESLSVTWRCRTLYSSDSYGSSEVSVAVVNSGLQYVAFEMGTDFVAEDRYSSGEEHLIQPVAANQFHTYQLTTSDFHQYEFYVDGVLTFAADFHWQALGTGPRAAFGDFLIGGVTSVAAWDFVEVAVTPEPTGHVLMLGAFLLSLCRRTYNV